MIDDDFQYPTNTLNQSKTLVNSQTLSDKQVIVQWLFSLVQHVKVIPQKKSSFCALEDFKILYFFLIEKPNLTNNWQAFYKNNFPKVRTFESFRARYQKILSSLSIKDLQYIEKLVKNWNNQDQLINYAVCHCIVKKPSGFSLEAICNPEAKYKVEAYKKEIIIENPFKKNKNRDSDDDDQYIEEILEEETLQDQNLNSYQSLNDQESLQELQNARRKVQNERKQEEIVRTYKENGCQTEAKDFIIKEPFNQKINAHVAAHQELRPGPVPVQVAPQIQVPPAPVQIVIQPQASVPQTQKVEKPIVIKQELQQQVQQQQKIGQSKEKPIEVTKNPPEQQQSRRNSKTKNDAIEQVEKIEKFIKVDKVEKVVKPEKSEKVFDKVVKNEKIDNISKPEKGDKIVKPEKFDKQVKPEKVEKVIKPEKIEKVVKTEKPSTKKSERATIPNNNSIIELDNFFNLPPDNQNKPKNVTRQSSKQRTRQISQQDAAKLKKNFLEFTFKLTSILSSQLKLQNRKIKVNGKFILNTIFKKVCCDPSKVKEALIDDRKSLWWLEKEDELIKEYIISWDKEKLNRSDLEIHERISFLRQMGEWEQEEADNQNH